MTAEEKTAKIEDYIARLDAEWPEIEKIMASHELDLDTGREPLLLCRIPPDMDFGFLRSPRKDAAGKDTSAYGAAGAKG